MQKAEQTRSKLEIGSDNIRLEDRQRGALAALKWAMTFLEAEAKMRPPKD